MNDKQLAEMKAADLAIPCPQCLAEAGTECEVSAPAWCHFARRVKRLCIERRPDLIDPMN